MSIAFSIFYFLSFGQGAFLSFLILMREKASLASIFLALLVVSISLQLLSYGLAYSNLMAFAPHMWGMGSVVFFLFAPSLYFFIRLRLEKGYRWKLWDLGHVLPLLSYLLYHRGFFFVSGRLKRNAWIELQGILQPKISLAFVIFFLLGSTLLMFYWWEIRKLLKKSHNDKELRILKWVLTLFSAYIAFFLIYKISLILGSGYYRLICHSTKALMGVCIYAISYLAFNNLLSVSPQKKSYSQSLLTERFATELNHKLARLMVEEQVFKDSGLSLDKLANLLGCSVHELSQLLNGKHQKTFPAYINGLRVAYAQQLLTGSPHLKIWEVAADVGFNNRVTFNAAFQREVGMSPSAFKKGLLSRASQD